MVQKRLRVIEGIEIPSCGISRSRNVRMKLSRQSRLAESSEARKDLGNPPRVQRRAKCAGPTSFKSNPERSTNPIRPARDSETPLTNWREAEPRSRNLA